MRIAWQRPRCLGLFMILIITCMRQIHGQDVGCANEGKLDVTYIIFIYLIISKFLRLFWVDRTEKSPLKIRFYSLLRSRDQAEDQRIDHLTAGLLERKRKNPRRLRRGGNGLLNVAERWTLNAKCLKDQQPAYPQGSQPSPSRSATGEFSPSGQRPS
jgi:hypothetical protein